MSKEQKTTTFDQLKNLQQRYQKEVSNYEYGFDFSPSSLNAKIAQRRMSQWENIEDDKENEAKKKKSDTNTNSVNKNQQTMPLSSSKLSSTCTSVRNNRVVSTFNKRNIQNKQTNNSTKSTSSKTNISAITTAQQNQQQNVLIKQTTPTKAHVADSNSKKRENINRTTDIVNIASNNETAQMPINAKSAEIEKSMHQHENESIIPNTNENSSSKTIVEDIVDSYNISYRSLLFNNYYHIIGEKKSTNKKKPSQLQAKCCLCGSIKLCYVGIYGNLKTHLQCVSIFW